MKISALVLTVLCLSIPSIALAKAVHVSGKVVGLDVDAQTVSIERDEDKSRVTYRYVDGFKVRNIGRRSSDVSDLVIGADVVLKLEPVSK